ncbi:MAG: hypothetical protein ACW99U_09850 [Candidatus Thorarchaeota archaeon]|jgi:hypothetical protein
MKRKRGRPVLPLPVHPERVISTAFQTGLSSTVRLQRSIKNKTTQTHYESSREIWRIARHVYLLTKERGNPEYSYVLKAAPQIMDNMLKMLYEKNAKYGHTEVSRQRNSDDSVGPFNQRMNACGAALRNFSVCMFPMPDPVQFGHRTQHAGKKRKRFRVAGYEGSSFGPRVVLAHPDLAPLDFGDAVRGHNEYLSAFCTIRDVPVNETTKYSNLFLLLVRPYLEHIYSECNTGKPEFRKGVNEALRFVKGLITQDFQPVKYTKKTVTGRLEGRRRSAKANTDFFQDQLEEAKTFYDDHPAIDELERLLNGGYDRNPGVEEPEESCLTEKDVEHVRVEALKRARVTGSIAHRRISDLFPSPWNMKDAIHNGHKYVGPSGYCIVSEAPLRTADGMGKADLVLLEPTIVDGKRGFCIPQFVLEIKTRIGQGWYFEAEEKISTSRSYKGLQQRVVCKFLLRDRPIENNEWNVVVKVTPRRDAREQVDAYAEMLTENYQTITGQSPHHILSGTIVIESTANIDEVRRVIESLVVTAYETVRNKTGKIDRTVFTPSNSSSRVALVVHEQDTPKREQEKGVNPSWSPHYNPFIKTQESKRQFTLYLAGKTLDSGGASAAWNARYYHGLQMLHDERESNPDAGFVWIDLASQFTEPRFAEARLRLRPRGYSEEETAKTHPDHIRELFEEFETRGFLREILSFLYEGGGAPSFDIGESGHDERIIIVSGADILRNATPSTHRDQLQLVFDQLLNSLPDDEITKVLWFDSPVPSTEKATPYATRALLPFYENSSLREFVTEIIWNLPVAPRRAVEPEKWGLPIIGDTSMHDDVRVVLRHSPQELEVTLVHTPLLRGWSKRFKNQGLGLVVKEHDVQDIVTDKMSRVRMKLLSMTMLPWLAPLWSDTVLFSEPGDTLERQCNALNYEFRGAPNDLTFDVKVMTEPRGEAPSILELLKYRLPDAKAGKMFVSMTQGRINSRRLYRSPNRLKTESRPSLETVLPSEEKVVQDEPEQDWSYGVKFDSDDEDVDSWWIVLQDPAHIGRMLVGCFTNKPLDKDGFNWAETKSEALTQHSVDEILGSSQTLMLCRMTEQGLETWGQEPDGELEYAGVLEIKKRGHSSIGQLIALRQTPVDGTFPTPALGSRPSKSFYQSAAASLRRYIESVTSPTPVAIGLEMIEDACRVVFADDDKVIQEVEVEYVADLLSLLRWPMTRGNPMFTDKGTYVTWSVFDDIDYGELAFIQPYVIYKAARYVPEELPTRVAQFFEEAEELLVSIEHDLSVCPIELDDEVGDHEACWRIALPPTCPEPVRKQLGGYKTGEEVNGLLASGRLYASRLYEFDVILPEVSENDESVVFHEERYIRILLRSHGLSLRALKPGTYLRIGEQKWRISLSWAEKGYVRWSAQSTVTGLLFIGSSDVIELSIGLGRKDQCENIIDVISSHLQSERILDSGQLQEEIRFKLEDLGHPLEGLVDDEDFDEEFAEPAVWEVTLVVVDSAIQWEGEQVNGRSHRGGVLYDDPKVLVDGNERSAIREVRETVEGDLVLELKHIENIDEILKNQVVEVVREIRESQEKTDA